MIDCALSQTESQCSLSDMHCNHLLSHRDWQACVRGWPRSGACLQRVHGGGQLRALHVRPGVELLAHACQEGGRRQEDAHGRWRPRRRQQAQQRKGRCWLEHLQAGRAAMVTVQRSCMR